MTCIHQPKGLCPACEQEYQIDPDAWIEFGDHPDGIQRWKDLQAEMEQDRLNAMAGESGPSTNDPDVPF